MGSVSPEWLKIAADMIDARRIEVGAATTDVEMVAASYIFDAGIFYLGDEGMQEVKAMLLEKYDRAIASQEKGEGE